MTITNDPQQLLSNNQKNLPPIESIQYRAIGRMWGRYIPNAEQIRQGQLITSDGVIINVNLMSKVALIVENRLDLSQEYLWTVYPKTPPTDLGIGLYLSLIGVKAPSEYTELIKTELQDQADSFSIQGEVIYQNFDSGIVTVKIQQTPRNKNGTPKEFRLKLLGFLPPKSARHFWNLHVRRVGTDLVIQSGQCIKFLRQRQSKTKKLSTISSENIHELAETNARIQSTEQP
ncbi:hypothetical protein A6770_39735 [Nostoc minutum NIES-26]|uniref:Uncharacterized protein n=1 Tax=Nostoc minutum NIES-26 TaxID=1844469 RepID=A0A367RRE3_9NOSO|nr:hypothetical protein A6770_39735 [Nostoc minutum NIES-26]